MIWVIIGILATIVFAGAIYVLSTEVSVLDDD